MGALAINVTVNLTEITCGGCGGTYAISERYRQHKEDHGDSWTCPYCKIGWGYTKGTIAKLRDEIKAEKERHERTLARANEAEARERRLAKRVKHGVCPCCQRTFAQLARHMAAKHPEFKAA